MSIAIENKDKALELTSSSSGTSVNFEVFREHYVSYSTPAPIVVKTSDITKNITIQPKPVVLTITSENPSDPSYPGDMIYAFFINGIKVTDETASSLAGVLEYSSAHPQTIKLIEGTKITYQVSRALYVPKSGVVTVTKTQTINVILSKEPVYFTLKIRPNPSNAKVVLTCPGFKQINNQITVSDGSQVQVTVSRNYYETKSTTILMDQEKTLDVILNKIQYTLTVDADPSTASITFNKGEVSGNKTTVYADDATVTYTVSAPTFVTIQKTINLTENTTVTEYLNYASGTVIFESSNAGTYTRTLRPGTYIIYLVGAGAGCAYNYYHSNRTFHTHYAAAAIASGGTGAYLKYTPFQIKKTATVVISLGAPSGAASGSTSKGGDSTLTIDGVLIGTAGGAGGAYAYAYHGTSTSTAGCGGVASSEKWVGNTSAFGTCYRYSGLNGRFSHVVWSHNTVSVPDVQSPFGNDKGKAGGGYVNCYGTGSQNGGGSGYCKIVVA